MTATLHTVHRSGSLLASLTADSGEMYYSGHGRVYHERQGVTAGLRTGSKSSPHGVFIVNGRLMVLSGTDGEVSEPNMGSALYGDGPNKNFGSCLCTVGNSDGHILVGSRWSGGFIQVLGGLNLGVSTTGIKISDIDVLRPWRMLNVESIVKINDIYMVFGHKPAWLYTPWTHPDLSYFGIGRTRYWPEGSSPHHTQRRPDLNPVSGASSGTSTYYPESFHSDSGRYATEANDNNRAVMFRLFTSDGKGGEVQNAEACSLGSDNAKLPRMWFTTKGDAWLRQWEPKNSADKLKDTKGKWGGSVYIHGAMPRVTWPYGITSSGDKIVVPERTDGFAPFGETRATGAINYLEMVGCSPTVGGLLKVWYRPAVGYLTDARRWLRHIQVANYMVEPNTYNYHAVQLKVNASTLAPSGAVVAGYEPVGLAMIGIINSDLKPGVSRLVVNNAWTDIGEFTGFGMKVRDCAVVGWQPGATTGDTAQAKVQLRCFYPGDMKERGTAAPAPYDNAVIRGGVAGPENFYIYWEVVPDDGCVSRNTATHAGEGKIVVRKYTLDGNGITDTAEEVEVAAANPADFAFL